MLITTPLIGSGPVLNSSAICHLLELHCAMSDRQGEIQSIVQKPLNGMLTGM